ncbi:restriction endonuclease [Lacunimicrobium album]
MPTLSMVESQAVAELAESLYDFLPATFSTITWPDVAQRCGVRECWPDGSSKKQSIPIFLRSVLENRRGSFCDMIVAVVQEGINYKSRKGNSVTRDEIERINRSLLKVQFKIPQLNDRQFLDGLPLAAKEPVSSPQKPTVATPAEVEKLRLRFISLFSESDTQKRGLAFEPFLNDFFTVHGLDPRGSFRILGEQIDGSFEWQGDTFLVEARWRKSPANTADLLVLRGKAEKSDWTRGLFISMNGFSDLATTTLQIGRKANLIAMSGHDLILILEHQWTLQDALRAKLRHTGETAEAYKPLIELAK